MKQIELKRIGLIIVFGEGIMSLLERNWCTNTKKFKRKMTNGFEIMGYSSMCASIKSNEENHDVLVIRLPSRLSEEKIAEVIKYAGEGLSADEVMFIGNIPDMKRFLPKEPRIGSRYQPLIGIDVANWGLLIKDHEQMLVNKKNEQKFEINLLNELVSATWNLEREIFPGGFLYVAKKMYEGTWRDPWSAPCKKYGCCSKLP